MTPAEFQNRKLPEYYKTMFLDGFSPAQILVAAHQEMLDRLTEPEETEVHIVNEVNVK